MNFASRQKRPISYSSEQLGAGIGARLARATHTRLDDAGQLLTAIVGVRHQRCGYGRSDGNSSGGRNLFAFDEAAGALAATTGLDQTTVERARAHSGTSHQQREWPPQHAGIRPGRRKKTAQDGANRRTVRHQEVFGGCFSYRIAG